MDKEQAIELLEHLAWDRDIDRNLCGEALNMAIDALKAQLSMEDATKGATSDLIDRQQAIDVLHGYFDGMLDTDTVCPADIYGLFECSPSAQPEVLACGNGELVAKPEPKEGHWIDKGWDGDWAWQTDGRGNCWRVIECSECGKSVLVESNYCPHCGSYNGGGRK